jgi:transcriptional regulator with XRE-family HTH domain
MSPFAIALRNLRFGRGLSQDHLAAAVGCQRTYVSGLENDNHVAPPAAFVARIRDALPLSEQEYAALEGARLRSRRSYQVPEDSAPAVYELVYELFSRLDQLTGPMVEALTKVLQLSEQPPPLPRLPAGRVLRRDRREATKEETM